MNDIETQIEALETWFENWCNNPKFSENVYWKLTRGTGSTSKAGRHVFTNSMVNEQGESFELLCDHVRSEFMSGESSLTVTLSPNKSYQDNTLPSKTMRFKQSKSSMGLSGNNAIVALLMQSKDNEKETLRMHYEMMQKHSEERYEERLRKQDEKIAGLAENQKAESKMDSLFGFIEKLLDNSDKFTDVAQKWRNAPALGSSGFRVETEEEEEEENGNISQSIEGFDYMRGMDLLNRWYNLDNDILDSLEKLYLFHDENPKQMSELLNQL